MNKKKPRKESTRIKINASFSSAIGALLAVKPKRKKGKKSK